MTPDQIVLSKSLFIVGRTVSTNWSIASEDGWNFVMEKIKNIVIWRESKAQKKREQLLRSSAKKCCLCKSEIESDAVLHHYHATGEVYGLAHSKCKLKARTVKFLPVFFHNLARYEAHHILKYLQLRPNEIHSAIACTGETFVTFSIKFQTSEYPTKQEVKKPIYSEIRFLDSFQFMSQGLDGLAKTAELGDLKHSRSKFSYL